jgi:FSR family fosmidomycin resistance protein-like MFS transporter
VPAGALAAATITLAGLIGHYHLLMAFLLVSGLGVAAFHPEAARLINRAGGTRPGSAMSIFSVGGTAGFALAPILTAVIVSQAGKTGLLVVLVGVFVITAWLIAHLPRYQSLTVPSRARLSGRGSIGRDHWGPFAILGLSIGLRSTMFYGLMTFLALIWVQTYGQSKHAGNIALGLMLGSAVAGTLIGGWLSDRHGPLAVTRLGFVGTTVCLGLLCLASNAVVATLLLVPLGVVMALTGSPVVVLGQAYLPNRVGTASGVTIGLAVSVGGVVAPILGHWADTAGLGIIFPVVTGLAGLAAVLAYLLPQPRSS